MNERIKQFAEQATQEFSPTFERDKWQEKFAQLIVQECVEQCNINFVGTVGTHPNAHNRGVQKCIDNIKQYFGVD